jgi:hypothetical protein
MSDIVERLRHFALFLTGNTAISGAWFGDNADGERGKFWWRKYLPLTEAAAAIESLRAEKVRLTEERDALVEAVERARRHAENIGITDGSYIAQLDAALAKIKGGPDAR